MSAAQKSTSSPFRRLAAWYRRNDMWLLVGGLAFIFVFILLWERIVVSIDSGHAGVHWSRIFGTDTNRAYSEGTHLIKPWNRVTIYDVRYQKVDRTLSVLSRDGLDIQVDVTIRFRAETEEVPFLHQQIGPDYVEKLVIPEAYSAVRAVINQYRPEELYAAAFRRIQSAVTDRTRRAVRTRYVNVDNVLIRRITLPPLVRNAIQRKLEQEQRFEEMRFRLQREEQEAQRKRIEAQGIRDYHNTIATSLANADLGERILRLRGITATRELAQSANAKLVIIGGRDGLPLILNADSGVATVPAAAAGPGGAPALASDATTPDVDTESAPGLAAANTIPGDRPANGPLAFAEAPGQ